MNNEVGYREVRRGDIYWYRMDNGWGHETGAGRPIVIVSSDEGNSKSPTLIGAFTTTQMKYGKVFVPIVYDGVESWVKCCDLNTFDRAKRLGKYIGTLTDAQMAEVDRGLLRALDLDYCYDDEEYDEPEDEEVYEEDESENLEDKIAELELELKIARAAYDKLLARVVDMKVEADIVSVQTKAGEPPKIEPPKVVAPVKEVVAVAKPEPKIDVNTASETALKKIGWDSDSAKAILANRPFETLEELKSLPGVTKTLFNLVSPRMDCVRVVKEVVPVLAEKVNINTWSVDQITEALGCPKTNAGQIVAHRIKNGAFSDVNELYNVTGLSRLFVSRHIDCFTVGEPVAKVAVVEEKVNINTMKGPEIQKILGCPKSYAGYIVTYRNKNGLFKDKAELFNVPHIRNMVEKFWDRFEL